jgi:hypothetical protein
VSRSLHRNPPLRTVATRGESNRNIYFSPWLSSSGIVEWPSLLRDAAQYGNDGTLAAELRRKQRLRTHSERKKPTGGTTPYKVPVTAFETIVEGEFNRFYVRAICRRALAAGIPWVEIYRAKQVATPRAGSSEKIGTLVAESGLGTPHQ